jgi:ABC-type phosphate transport system permease subunit
MPQQPDAFIVTVIQEPEREMTVADLIIGSLGLAGALLLLALLLGVLAGVVLVVWNRFRLANWRPMPPVSPSWSGPDGPPSARAR